MPFFRNRGGSWPEMAMAASLVALAATVVFILKEAELFRLLEVAREWALACIYTSAG